MTEDKLRTELLRAQTAIYNALQTLPKGIPTAPDPIARQDSLKPKADSTPQFTATSTASPATEALVWKPTKNPAIEFAWTRVSQGGHMMSAGRSLVDLVRANGGKSITKDGYSYWLMNDEDRSVFRKKT